MPGVNLDLRVREARGERSVNEGRSESEDLVATAEGRDLPGSPATVESEALRAAEARKVHEALLALTEPLDPTDPQVLVAHPALQAMLARLARQEGMEVTVLPGPEDRPGRRVSLDREEHPAPPARPDSPCS